MMLFDFQGLRSLIVSVVCPEPTLKEDLGRMRNRMEEKWGTSGGTNCQTILEFPTQEIYRIVKNNPSLFF